MVPYAKPTIICIDDQPDIVDFLAESLESIEYPVLTFVEPQKAFSYILKHHQHICMIFSDIDMPVLDGMTLRKNMLLKGIDIPFCMITGNISEDILFRGIELKIRRFFAKPVDPDDLTAIFETEGRRRAEAIEEMLLFKQGFAMEAQGVINELEPLMLQVEKEPGNLANLSEACRLIHTIRAGSNATNWSKLTKFLTYLENLLTQLKNQSLVVNSKIVSLLINSFDYLSFLTSKLDQLDPPDIDLEFWKRQLNLESESYAKPIIDETRGSSPFAPNALEVPISTLDELAELSGETAVIKNTLTKITHTLGRDFAPHKSLSALTEILEEMYRINHEIQDKIIDLRKITFQSMCKPFPRMVRDLAASLNKNIYFKIEGAGTRIDSKMTIPLSNALTQALKNAVVHGIEFPHERLSQGKPPQGSITIHIYERGDYIHISVHDDGKGINFQKLRENVSSRKILNSVSLENTPDQDLISIFFDPEDPNTDRMSQSAIQESGLGLMKGAIQEIRGVISIESTKLKGTSVLIVVPIPKPVLTLTSLIVDVENQKFSIPQEDIYRLFSVNHTNKALLKRLEGVDVVSLGSEMIQVIPLAYILGLTNQRLVQMSDFAEFDEINIVIIKTSHRLFGLKVDRIHHTEESSVKNLAPYIRSIGLYKGATLTSEGQIGLILNSEKIAERANLNKQSGDTVKKVHHLKSATPRGPETGFLTLNLRGNPPGEYCIRLENVQRIEEFAQPDINILPEVSTVLYRKDVIPFFDPLRVLNLPHEELGYVEKSTAIISVINSQTTAIEIEGVKNVKYINESIQTIQNLHLSKTGKVLIEGKLYTVINPIEMIHHYEKASQKVSGDP